MPGTVPSILSCYQQRKFAQADFYKVIYQGQVLESIIKLSFLKSAAGSKTLCYLCVWFPSYTEYLNCNQTLPALEYLKLDRH